MATALLKKLDDLTECSICREEYKDPRQLPCLHSFCLKCLEVYAGDKLLCRSMSCPLCRKETKLPHDGIKEFPRNFFIEKIMEIRRLSGPVTEAKKCDVCFGDEESAASSKDAAMCCTNCHYNLCTRCTNDHRRHMKKHCIVELGCGKVTEQLLETLATSYCSSHPQDAVRMFCLDCKVVMCFVCFAEKHQMHKCSDINKEAEIMRKQIESDIKGVSSCLLAFQQNKTEMDDKKEYFLEQIETVEKDVLLRSYELKQIIDRDTKALLNELESIKSSELKDMCVKTEELERCVTVLNSFKAYGEEIVALGSASDVCHSYYQFHDRYDEITGNFKDPPFKEFLPKRVTFKTRSLNEVQQKNLVGRIEAPLSLALRCYDELENGKESIRCPDPGTLRCENPECKGNQSLFNILAICAMTEVNDVECPSKRACPRCYTVIEHVKVCKDRTCDYCEYEFCFLCLKPYPCKTDVCGTCDVAPRQTPAPIRPITKGEAWWQILVRNISGETIAVHVPADCFVDEFFRMLYNHQKAPKVCGYRVIFNGRELDNRGKRRLSEYGVQNHSFLHLLIRLTGG